MINDVSNEKISKDSDLNNLFLSANLSDINENCKILKDSFYLDSFNYFPITSKDKTFKNLFKRKDDNSIEHFFNRNFYENFKVNKKKFKVFENCFVLGSSPANNYYSNLIHFLPRIFFTNEEKINLIIHRNLSNNFRNLITTICKMRKTEVRFNFIDDEFYKFDNSYFPQFFSIEKSVKILKYFFENILSNIKDLNYGSKIYIRREDANYRKILNEADIIEKLRKNGFSIINPNDFEILQQMKIISNANIIISPYGSNLSNIFFCKQGTKIIEIGPNFDKPYEINISNRYKQLSNISELVYFKINEFCGCTSNTWFN